MVKRDLSDHLKSYESYFLDIYFFFFFNTRFLDISHAHLFLLFVISFLQFLDKIYEKIKYPRVTISSCSNLIFEI